MHDTLPQIQQETSRDSERLGHSLLAMDRVGSGRELAMDRVGSGRSERVDRGRGKGSARGAAAGGRGGVHAPHRGSDLDGKTDYAARAAFQWKHAKHGQDKGYAADAMSPTRKRSRDRAPSSSGGRGASRTRDELREYAAAVRKRDRRGGAREEGGGSDRSETREKGRGRAYPRESYRDRDVSGENVGVACTPPLASTPSCLSSTKAPFWFVTLLWLSAWWRHRACYKQSVGVA